MKRILALLIALSFIVCFTGCTAVPTTTAPLPATSTFAPTAAPESTPAETTVPETTIPETTIPETTLPAETEPLLAIDGHYNSKEDVALYVHLYGCLPRNYVTKDYARNTLGCSTSRVQDYWPDGAIGGDIFYNREGRLPAKEGRVYYECYINTWGKYSNGMERIVFSNDGLVYYTGDHYATFELMYGEP